MQLIWKIKIAEKKPTFKLDKSISIFKLEKIYKVKPRYPDTLWTRKNCRHKQSVTVTRVRETCVYKKLCSYNSLFDRVQLYIYLCL